MGSPFEGNKVVRKGLCSELRPEVERACLTFGISPSCAEGRTQASGATCFHFVIWGLPVNRKDCSKSLPTGTASTDQSEQMLGCEQAVMPYWGVLENTCFACIQKCVCVLCPFTVCQSLKEP